MKTIKDVFADYKAGLSQLYVSNEVEAVTLLIISEILGFSKAKIKAFPELELSEAQYTRVTNILSELKTGKPIQYILGKTEFYGLPFLVNPSVLIPRPETEELVEGVIHSINNRKRSVDVDKGRILDVGTGSGCIAIAIKKNLPVFEVSAIDISTAALQTARENAALNEVDINFIEADILNLNAEMGSHKYEIIISNPPYVTLHDKTQMHHNVVDFEPHTALFVPENDPLLFYNAIADFAKINLTPNGFLFFEINESYGSEVVNLLRAKGFLNIELKKDMSDRDRMIRALNRD
jgi:release factor glutamine methyltransferase